MIIFIIFFKNHFLLKIIFWFLISLTTRGPLYTCLVHISFSISQRGDKFVTTQIHPNHLGGVMDMHIANAIPDEQASQISINAHQFIPNSVVSMQNVAQEEYEMPPRIRRTQGNNRFNNSRHQQMPMNFHQRSFNSGRGIMGQGPGILRPDARHGNNRFHYQPNMPFGSNSFGR